MISNKTVSIVEIYDHHIFVETLCRILHKQDNKIIVYTIERIYQDLSVLLNDFDIVWRVKGSDESDLNFLIKSRKEIDGSDYLFVNTVQGKRIILFWLIKFNVITFFGAGRVSDFFRKKYAFFGFKSFRDLIYHNYSKFFLSILKNRIHGIIVHTHQAKEFALSNGYNGKIIQLPFSLPITQKSVGSPSKDDVIYFTVTGSIREFNRDHYGVTNAMYDLWLKGFKNFHLTILSSIPKNDRQDYAKAYIDHLEELSKNSFPIEFFRSRIPEETYLDILKRTHFFIAPINIDYYSCGELTSTIVESIRVRKPAFYPEIYQPDKNLINASIFFNDFEDFKEKVQAIIKDNENITNIYDNALKSFKVYELENLVI